jgi:hypothetical protein
LKLSRNYMVFGSLAVAVTALVVDKLYFSEPSSAQASLVSQAAPTPPTVNKPESATVTPPLPEASEGLISDHLKIVPEVDLTETGDAFSPSKAWMLFVRPPPPPPPAAPPPEAKVDHSGTDFVAAHKLSGVLESHNGGAAIVDGEMLLVGQTLDGFTLTAVQSTTARFTNGTIVVELTIAQ